MLTVTCHFQFADGAAALASVSVPSPHSEQVVQYAGDHSRLPSRIAAADAAYLRAWAEDIAPKLNAKLTVEESGQYDWWAE